MGLSFEESMKKATLANNPSVAPAALPDVMLAVEPGVMTTEESYTVAAYSGEDGSWN